MRLARKLIAVVVLTIFVVIAVQARLRLTREAELFTTDIQRDHHVMARALAPVVAEAWEDGGDARATAFVERANQRESDVEIRWVWLDGADDPHLPEAPPEVLIGLGVGVPLVWADPSEEAPGHLYTYYGVEADPQRRSALELKESLKRRAEYLRDSGIRVATFALILALASALGVTAMGVYLVGRPVRQLIDQAQRVGSGDLSRRLDLRQEDELGELAQEMNAMCDRLQEADAHLKVETEARFAVLQQLRHADRLMTVGKLASGIAHELGTPLNVIGARGKMIHTGEVEGEEAQDNGRIIHEQAARMTRIIRQLLDFARPRAPTRSQASLASIAVRTLELLQPMARKSQVELSLGEGDREVPVDPGQIQQVLTNLVANGIQAMPSGGTLTVTVSEERLTPPAQHSLATGLYARIDVVDQGVGIAPEILDHLFEPFFTTREVGEGTGLGLSVTWGIVREHQGWIQASSTPGSGSRFSVYLPTGEVTPSATPEGGSPA